MNSSIAHAAISLLLLGTCMPCAAQVESHHTDPAGTEPPVVPSAQGAQDESDSKMTGSLPELFARIGEVEMIRRAGLKASLLRQAQQSLSFVVVVDDAPSYLYAISQWEGLARFPVLWDDGSVRGREDIARFVRAYKPERVLRLQDDGDWDWSKDRDERQERIELSLSKALSENSDDWEQSLASIQAQGIVSPGIVLTDAGDNAWTGALALAAGRFQPLGFMVKPADIFKPLEAQSGDAIERAAEQLATRSGRSWKERGDDIDAITLAMNTGTAIKTGAGDRDLVATSDRIGRTEHNGAGDRWAWCGQLIGSEAQSAYRAMCGLFLELDQAFIWDGYGNGPGWSDYDGTKAGEMLEIAGMKPEVNDAPKNTIEYWYQRMIRPIGSDEGGAGSALLMLMNSKGSSRRFDLDGGTQEEGYAGELPTLEVPAALHLVHSFSLQQPFQPKSIGGRLLDRGVYAYAGSVDEPFLSGFIPTPEVALRLGMGVAFGTAIRWQGEQVQGVQTMNPSHVWKIAVLGDPLVTLGSAGRRVQADLLIDSIVDVDTQTKACLKDGDYTNALRGLVMLGRDDDASRLALALLKDRPQAVTPELALSAMGALQRAGEFESMVDCFEHLDNAGREDMLMRDLLWLVSPYLFARANQDESFDARVQALLRASLRSGQEVSDAERLAMHMRSRSMASALSVLESLRPGMNENQQRMLDRAIDRVKR